MSDGAATMAKWLHFEFGNMAVRRRPPPPYRLKCLNPLEAALPCPMLPTILPTIESPWARAAGTSTRPTPCPCRAVGARQAIEAPTEPA
jgi:hypothetical protein